MTAPEHYVTALAVTDPDDLTAALAACICGALLAAADWHTHRRGARPHWLITEPAEEDK